MEFYEVIFTKFYAFVNFVYFGIVLEDFQSPSVPVISDNFQTGRVTGD